MSKEQKSHEEELWECAREFDGIPRAESYHELSRIAYEREEFSEALNMCLIAKDIFKADQSGEHVSNIFNLYQGILNSYESLKQCDKGEETLLEAIEFSKANSDRNLGFLLRQLGRLYFEHKKYAESIESHTQAMMLPHDSEVDHLSGIDYLNIGMSYQRLKNYEEAIRYEFIALDKFKEDKAEPHWLVHVYGELAESYVGLQISHEIIYYSSRALDWWETEKNYENCMTLKYFMAIGQRLDDELDEALDLLMEARELAIDHLKHPQEFLVDIDKEEGEILIMQGKVDAGRSLIRRAESVRSMIEETQ